MTEITVDVKLTSETSEFESVFQKPVENALSEFQKFVTDINSKTLETIRGFSADIKEFVSNASDFFIIEANANTNQNPTFSDARLANNPNSNQLSEFEKTFIQFLLIGLGTAVGAKLGSLLAPGLGTTIGAGLGGAIGFKIAEKIIEAVENSNISDAVEKELGEVDIEFTFDINADVNNAFDKFQKLSDVFPDLKELEQEFTLEFNIEGVSPSEVGDQIQDVIHEIERSSSTNGVDQTINLPFVYEHVTADRLLDYKRKRFVAAVKSLNIDVGQDAINSGRGELASIHIPSLDVSSDWEITGTNVTPAGSQSLSLVPYSALPYTYVPFTSEGGTLPTDASFDIAPDFSNTPPDPVSGLIVVGSVRLTEQSDRAGVLDISWTPPNDGNYQHAEVFIKENGQGASSYKSYGMFETGTTIDSLKANEAYDVLVVSISPDGNKGLGTEKTNTTTGSATSAPGTPWVLQ